MEAADTISPSNIELEEKQNDGLAVNRDKKRTRFKSPIRHIFKPKKNDESSSYYRLQEEKQYSDLQFKEPSVKVPVYAISLAAGLFLVGTVMITLGALMLTGRIETQYSDRTWPLILIGSIVFLPGFYHLRIAYWAWKGDKNFSFSDIPDLDWF
ncbi:unnamed protein product [Adineta ricciae]|uniref:Transmembrane protein 230 n=1 Tax=Adineta ricciae TaxID=249248 RepID=A0A814G8V4_ADIRI|nr:unnamed protein product [Adineta ricciae]